MRRQGRFERARELLHSRGRDADPAPAEEPAPDEELGTADAAAPPEEADGYSGQPPVTLGDINEGRRESVARRLRSLRERGSRQSDEPAPDDRDRPPRARASAGDRLRSAGAAGRGLAGRATATREPLVTGARRAGTTLGSAGAGAATLWRGIPAVMRVRIAAAAIVAALVVLVLVVVVPAAPCGAPGGDECAPPDDAIALVPDDALAYVHLDIDPESEQFAAAAELGSRLPLLSRLAVGEVAGVAGRRVDFASQVRPWAGSEVAFAVLPGSGRLERVVLIEADDDEGARAFAGELLGPGAASEEVAGIEVSSDGRGAAGAIVDGFLAFGDEGAVNEVIDPEDGGTLETAAASTVVEDLPEERLAYAYLSGEGARALLDAEGSLAAFDTFVDAGATEGVGLALTASDGLLDLEVRSRLDPERVETSPPFFAALPPFAPSLPADVGSDALAYLGIGDPQASVESLLTQAAADAPALLSAFNRVEEDLRREGGISITEELLSLLGSEAALSVEPVAAEGAEPPPGTLVPSGVPYLSLLAGGVDTEAAARSLAALQEPLVSALAPAGSGKVGSFETLRIAGVDAQSLVVNPDVNLTYATFEDRLVVATNPIAVEQARAAGTGLTTAAEFEAVTAGLPEEVSLLSYFNLRSLLALGEQIGLSADPTYAPFAPDLRALDAAALAVSGGDEEIRTDVRIAVGEPEAAELESPPLAGG